MQENLFKKENLRKENCFSNLFISIFFFIKLYLIFKKLNSIKNNRILKKF